MSNIKNLIKKLSEHKIDHFLIPNSDQFLNEYIANSEKRIEFLTNFDGSNAFIILNKDRGYFFTDSRYLIAAKQQIDTNFFKIIDLSIETPSSFLLTNCANKIIHFDPKLHSAQFINNLKKNNLQLKSIYDLYDQNPIDIIWQNKIVKNKEIFLHKENYVGQSWKEKIKTLYSNLDKKSDGIFLSSPESCSYLFNIRSFVIDYVPTCPSYALISKNNDILLFLDIEDIEIEVKQYLSGVEITNFKNLPSKIKSFCQKNNIKNIEIDLDQTNYHILNIIEIQKLNVINKLDPVLLQKSVKNKTEINCIKEAHIKDSIAIIKFLYWIETRKDKSKISEIIAANKLLSFRREEKDFICPSFETISGFAENGAIIHYKVTKNSNKYFNKDSLYLFDSGGQYQYGTTDITRTILVGQVTKKQKNDFTLVLKGHISLAQVKFPVGTRADQLDILARQYLWKEGKNYGHGTGHGLGYFLNVHEGPCAISSKYNKIPLKEGMVLSNEPGLYIENEYGIRIENVILVKKSNFEDYLELETISYAPIDINLINFSLLSKDEKEWINNYHHKIYSNVKENISNNLDNFLQNIIKNYEFNL